MTSLSEIAAELLRYADEHDLDAAPSLLLLCCSSVDGEPPDEAEPLPPAVPEHYYPH